MALFFLLSLLGASPLSFAGEFVIPDSSTILLLYDDANLTEGVLESSEALWVVSGTRRPGEDFLGGQALDEYGNEIPFIAFWQDGTLVFTLYPSGPKGERDPDLAQTFHFQPFAPPCIPLALPDPWAGEHRNDSEGIFLTLNPSDAIGAHGTLQTLEHHIPIRAVPSLKGLDILSPDGTEVLFSLSKSETGSLLVLPDGSTAPLQFTPAAPPCINPHLILAESPQGILTAEDGLAFLDALLLVSDWMGEELSLSADQRLGMLQILGASFASSPPLHQEILAVFSSSWPLYRDGWDDLTLRDRELFAAGVLLLAFGDSEQTDGTISCTEEEIGSGQCADIGGYWDADYEIAGLCADDITSCLGY
ncbi:hypothetical protein H8D30_00395 [bacterium]|nr:hypothetical protein [bacterium]